MKTPNELAILAIRKCSSQLYCRNVLFGYSFKQASYYRWALRELIDILTKDRTTPPLLLIEEFMGKMDNYSCKSQETSFIFACARDASEWVLDTLTN